MSYYCNQPQAHPDRCGCKGVSDARERLLRSAQNEATFIALNKLLDAKDAELQALREEVEEWAQRCAEAQVQRDAYQQERDEVLRARVVVVPDGYALVPVEPTREMFVAVNKEDDKAYAGGCDHGAQFDWLWAAALDAAPRLNGKAVSEGLLRRIVEEQPAVQDIGEMFNWQYARDQAMAELRALLGEGKEAAKP